MEDVRQVMIMIMMMMMIMMLMSASPVLQQRPDTAGVRSRRLARIAACHHIPRVTRRFMSLDKMPDTDSGQDTLTEGSDNQSETALGDASQSEQRHTEAANPSGPVSFIFPSCADSEDVEDKQSSEEPRSFIFPSQENSGTGTTKFLFGQEDIASMKGESSPVRQDTRVVHCYVASRGQRERETDIYEVPPPPYFSLLSCDI